MICLMHTPKELLTDMGVSLNGGTPKTKPMVVGYHHLGNPHIVNHHL